MTVGICVSCTDSSASNCDLYRCVCVCEFGVQVECEGGIECVIGEVRVCLCVCEILVWE